MKKKLPKYFFEASSFNENSSEDAHCWQLDHFKCELKERPQEEIILHAAVRDYGSGYYYCTELGEVGEAGDGCGKDCPSYKPRNGKSGRCRFSDNTFCIGNRKFRLTKDGLEELEYGKHN